MTEHNCARFLAGQFPQLPGHDLAHSTEPFDVPGTSRFFQCHPAADRFRALGHDDDGVLPVVARSPAFDVRGDFGNVIRDFRDQNRIRPASDAGMQRKPPAYRPITSTTITRRCDSAVKCRRSMHSVANFTALSKPNVVIVHSRSLSIVFRHADNAQPLFVQIARDVERPVAADGNERVEPAFPKTSAPVRHRDQFP
jgi:hypothetical protein